MSGKLRIFLIIIGSAFCILADIRKKHKNTLIAETKNQV
jgi:hypothetical protein